MVAAIAVAFLSGCHQTPVVELATWTLTTPLRPDAVPLTLPAHVDAYVPADSPYYEMRTHVVLPEEFRHGPITLAIPLLRAIALLRVNGQTVRGFDEVEPGAYRSEDPQRFPIAESIARVGEFDVELHIIARWKMAFFFDSVPRLSATKWGDASVLRMKSWNQTIGYFGFWGVLIGSVSQACLYYFDRKPFHLWFAVAAACGAIYPAFMLGWTQSVLGRSDVGVLSAVFATAAYASVRASASGWPALGPTHPAWTYALVSIWVLGTIFGAESRFRAWVIPTGLTVGMLLATGIYFCWVFRKLKSGNTVLYNRTALIGWPVAIALGSSDMALWIGRSGRFHGWRAGCLGVGMVAMFRTISMGADYFFANRRAEAYGHELAKRLALLEARTMEAQQLNNELRAQVRTNASELAAVLARVSSSAMPMGLLREGAVVENRYEIQGALGSGAAGDVYRCVRLSDGRSLALKVLRRGGDRRSLARFAREAQMALRVSHPNVVQVVDIGVSSGGFAFLAMELVIGTPLSRMTAEYGKPEWALAVLRQVADGLEAIHAVGIVHRDLKPGNVLLGHTPAGGTDNALVVKISDFGIADAGESEGGDLLTQLTLPKARLGTPNYMSPEAYAGAGGISAASDIFSFGVLAWELLAGHYPSPALPIAVLIRAGDEHVARIGSLSEACPGIPPSIVDLIGAMLAFEPERRPTSSAVASALSHAPSRPTTKPTMSQGVRRAR